MLTTHLTLLSLQQYSGQACVLELDARVAFAQRRRNVAGMSMRHLHFEQCLEKRWCRQSAVFALQLC